MICITKMLICVMKGKLCVENKICTLVYALALEGKTIKENNEISFELIKTGNIL